MLTVNAFAYSVNAQMEIKIECAHDKVMPLDELKPHPANPNKHPEQQIALLAKIIKAQGRSCSLKRNEFYLGLTTVVKKKVLTMNPLGLINAPSGAK